jgi:NAD(P)-dependent dehydrogenase (short-subunit alcohol dehydrogenase family)
MMSADSNEPEVNVVLGATGGIGSAVCRALAARGSRLYLAARSSERLSSLASELDAAWSEVDATNPDQVEQLLTQASSEFGRVSGVANCVGSLLLKPAHRTSTDEWNETLSKNLGSAFATVRAAANVMRDSGGSVVLLSSAAATTGLPNHEAIAAAKAGIIGLMRAAAASYASSGLRVNAVAPGLIRTEMTRHLWSNDLAAAGSVAMHPLGRLGEPEDVASLLAWLLDPSNNWVTGQVFGVDGGLAHVRSRAKK